LISGTDKATKFYRTVLGETFAYVQFRIPEISDELFQIDEAMKAGFGWEHGPFELWDAVGLTTGIELDQRNGHPVAPWIEELARNGVKGFYQLKTISHNIIAFLKMRLYQSQDKKPLLF
jgi:3-hydroxyacyl-CoA dehydrogenase